MQHSWGPWLVGFIGVVIIGVGIYEIYDGWSEHFTRHFDSYKMSAAERKWAVRAGKFGYIALGIVVGIIGFLAVLGAIHSNSSQVGGIDTSLSYLIQQPYGPWLLGIIALGLISYAIYSFMGALWFRVKVKS